MGRSKKNRWYLGLDIGTNSVGFCATDEEYNILTKYQKLQCGSRLFEEGKDASQRRRYRCTRRRMARRGERIKLLRGLFKDAIVGKDPKFFNRLEESNYHIEDKSEKSKYSLFDDPKYKDFDYYKKYRTIYHLRQYLRKHDASDPRLLYLACHHLIKYRGHFLYETFNTESSRDFKDILEDINFDLKRVFKSDNFQLAEDKIVSVAEKLKDKESLNAEQLDIITSQLNPQRRKELTSILDSIRGSAPINLKTFDEVVDYESLQNDISLKKKLKEFRFGSPNYNELLPDIERYFDAEKRNDFLSLLNHMKEFYDSVRLRKLLDGHETISDAMVARYEKHHNDLKLFKSFVKRNCPEKYKEIFRKNYNHPEKKEDPKDVPHASYQNYIGSNRTNSKKEKSYSSTKIKNKPFTADYMRFLQYVKNLLDELIEAKRVSESDEDYRIIRDSVNAEDFCKKHNLVDNSVIPYQLTLKEMSDILAKQQHNFDFLTNDTVKKIKSILSFRIPYYVGPLSELHSYKDGKFSWIIKKKKEEKVLPWNFYDIVDINATREEFIGKMTPCCVKLRAEKALPKQSLLYQKYMVLNELNSVSVNNKRISQDEKKIIYKEICLKGEKLKNTTIENKLRAHYPGREELKVTSEIDFKAELSSLVKLKYVLGTDMDEEMCEDIILWHTVFSEGKSQVREKIEEKYGKTLDQDKIDKLTKLNFTGWGKFSKKFLAEIVVRNAETQEEALSVIYLLENTCQNLNEIINDKKYEPKFVEVIERENKRDGVQKIDSEYIKALHCSPSEKRSILQAIKIAKELAAVNGCPPSKIFVEVSRGGKSAQRGKIPDSRKQKIKSLYDQLEKHDDQYLDDRLLSEFKTCEDSDFQRDEIFLYFLQLGRCMYTGERIELGELLNGNCCEKDHIYPQNLCPGNPMDNMVLVKKLQNGYKSDDHSLKPEIIEKNKDELWKPLLERKLISQEKYKRLTEPLSQEIIDKFSNKQLNTTNIAVIETINALKLLFGNNESNKTIIVYSKAQRVSYFRRKYKLIKSRIINNLHHGYDAYLNIVVGNYWDGVHQNYKHSRIVKDLHLEDLFESDVPGIWKTSYITKIRDYVQCNNKNYLNKFAVTVRPHDVKGKFYDETIYPVNVGDIPIHNPSPSKTNPYDVSKSGGYKNMMTSYVCAVKYLKRGKKGEIVTDLLPVYVKDRQKATKKITELDIFKDKKDLKVTYGHIPFGSLLEIGGIRYYLLGRSLGGRDRIQLTVANEWQPEESIIKMIDDIEDFSNLAIDKKLKLDDNLTKYPYAKGKTIEKDKNLKVLEAIIEQFRKPIYREYTFSKKLDNLRYEKFKESSLVSQAKLITELLDSLRTGKNCDARLIGGYENETCRVVTSFSSLLKNVPQNCKKVYLISQSTTGLVEKKIDVFDEGLS